MDLPLLAQRHNDIRNGLSAPPKLGLNQIFQLITKPEWCLRMMFTKNKTFGNILGHAKGVKDLSSIVSWTNDQFDQELTWDYVKWIKKLWGGPLILKGILDIDDAEKAAMGFKLMEESLLSMADTIENVLGEDGALLAGLARATAGFVSLGTSYAAAMETADTTSERVAAGASAIAAGLGQIMALVSAQAQQNVREIDQMIDAEKRRDGKSKESIAKMQAMEKKKEQVQRKAFDTNKKLMIAQAIASTAAGIAATLPLMVPPTTGIATALMAMIAGIGAAQVALISQLSFSGGGGAAPKAAPQEISIGKRSERVDVSQQASAGELAYLRGERGIGSNANNFTPAGAAGMRKSYATGGEIMVGERGPEVIQPTGSGFNVVPNDKMGGQNLNANITINAIDAAGVEQVLTEQKGNIIGMIREAAHEHGEEFIESVNTSAYGSTSNTEGGYG